MSDSEESTARVHSLWDKLADFDAASPDKAILYLLSSMCALVNARNASWIDAVRTPDVTPGDPINGWRPRMRGPLYPTPAHEAGAEEQQEMLEAGSVDITTIRNVALAVQTIKDRGKMKRQGLSIERSMSF